MNNSPEITETFVYSGLLSASQAVTLGVVMAVIIAALGLYERRAATRPNWTPFLTLLRLIALAVVLWMLAGPSKVLTTKHTRAKSIGVFVDSSASMSLVDAIDGSGNSLRWQLADGSQKNNPAVQSLDHTVALLRAARRAIFPVGAEQADELQSRIEGAQRSVNLAREALGGLAANAFRHLPNAARILSDVEDSLESQISPALKTLLDSSASSGLDFERLKTCRTRLNAAAFQIAHLANQAAAGAEADLDSPARADLVDRGGLSRSQKVAAWLNDAETSWLRDIEAKATVERYRFHSETILTPSSGWNAPVDEDHPKAQSTDIGAAFQTAFERAVEGPFDALVFITDGGHNTKSDPRKLAPSFQGAPLHIVPIGNTLMTRDLVLHHTQAPRAVFRDDTMVVESMVTAYGCEGETIRFELLRGDQVVDQTTLRARSDVFDGRVTLRWKADELGRHQLHLRALPLSEERAIDNNDAKFEALVMEDSIRVLAADNYPRWEFRFLVNLFKRDKHVEFEQLLFQPRHSIDGTPPPSPSLPRRLDDWARYRVIILGDVPPEHLSPEQQQSLKEFVSDRGGTLVLVAGKSSMPGAYEKGGLADLLPVKWSFIKEADKNGFNLYLTAEGRLSTALQLAETPDASERLWTELSRRLPVYNLSPFSEAKPTGHTLIGAARRTADGRELKDGRRSFLSWQDVGKGRVVYIAAPVTYQLRYGQGDTFHHRFWGQLLRWAIAREMATGSMTVRLDSDKNHYGQREKAQITMRLNTLDGSPVTGAECKVEARINDQIVSLIEMKEEENNPGSYLGVMSPLTQGSVTLRAVGEQVDALLQSERRRDPVESEFRVDLGDLLELRHPLCNLPLLNDLADASEGLIVTPAGLPEALRQIDWEPETSETVKTEPIWNRWLFLWVIVICLTLEWAGRKLAGLV